MGSGYFVFHVEQENLALPRIAALQISPSSTKFNSRPGFSERKIDADPETEGLT